MVGSRPIFIFQNLFIPPPPKLQAPFCLTCSSCMFPNWDYVLCLCLFSACLLSLGWLFHRVVAVFMFLRSQTDPFVLIFMGRVVFLLCLQCFIDLRLSRWVRFLLHALEEFSQIPKQVMLCSCRRLQSQEKKKVKLAKECVSQHFSADDLFWKLSWNRNRASVLLGEKK